MDFATVLTAALGFFGTVLGSLCGVIAANKTVNFRLKNLEARLDSYGKIGERIAVLETEVDLIKLDLQILKEVTKHG